MLKMNWDTTEVINKIDTKNMRRIFLWQSLQELFTKILKACDKVVTSFLGDFVVERKIDEANTAHNFFSNQVYSKDMLEVIDSKIRQEREEIDYIKKIISGL